MSDRGTEQKTRLVIEAEHLSVDYRIRKRWYPAVRDVDLSIRPLEIHGLVGESGSGKSTLALALMQFLSPNARISEGAIHFGESDLATLPHEELRRFWGSRISLVPQSPMDALNPSLTIGRQMTEVTRLHLGLDDRASLERAAEALAHVQIADPERVLDRYPHQLSGGMLQRVMIALALSTRPELIVLDEPTTALDVTTQAVILDLVRGLVKEEQAAGLYVSHDLGTVAQISDWVTVLYAGEVMESASVEDLFHNAHHPYTIGLLACLPARAERGEERLAVIPGVAPSLRERSSACVFADRCPVAMDRCRAEKPSLEQTESGRLVRCWRWKEIAEGALSPEKAYERELDVEARGTPPADSIVMQASHMEKQFGEVKAFDRLLGKTPEYVRAVDDVSVGVRSQSTFGLVGESGSGKTTLARAIVGLGEADDGTLELLGAEIPLSLKKRDAKTLSNLRLIFQNPSDALNPHKTVGKALERTIKKLGAGEGPERLRAQVVAYLEAVGLTEEYYRRVPSQLSGGEKQRVAIARAFAANPALVVADEPTSSLDVSVQAVILNLLKDLRAQEGASYLFISHDLDVISYLADWIAVMYLGEVMEHGPNEALLKPPWHPYTEALLKSAPVPDPTAKEERIGLEGDVPSPRNKPSGCPFHTRCPRFIGSICVEQSPPVRTTEEGNEIRCHHTLDELREMQEGS
ncbi:MAG: dipeptide ABC transporter ATP-binding protein [Spirochaetales bacterium]